MNHLISALLRSFYILIITLMILAGDSTTYAQSSQSIDVPSTWNPIGSGARAVGGGGAFIAIADDATAASWNPVGLIQLETPEVSILGTYINRTDDLNFGNAEEASGEQNVWNGNLNYLSAAYPFSLFNRNMIVCLNYQYLYDFTREWGFPLNTESIDTSIARVIDYEQSGSLSAIGLAYCLQLTPLLSFGITLNYWGDSITNNGWEINYLEVGSGSTAGQLFNYRRDSTEKYSFSGINANLWFLWKFNNSLSIGGVFKTPFSADLNAKSTHTYSIEFPDAQDQNINVSESTDEDQNLDMPMSYGIGIAYRFSDQITASFDIYRTEWDDFVLTDAEGNKISPINRKPENKARVEPATQIRLGAEYLFLKNRYIVPIRGGVFYDPAPAEGSPDDIYGFSLGSGIASGKIVFDVAYQYRFGNDLSTYIMESQDFSMDIREHTVYASLIYHF